MNEFLKISGDYREWSVYRKSMIICDITEYFIGVYLPRNSRTIDQMRQAARSCKQNIVEGVSDNTISTEMCIRLIGVARGSVRELLEDYNDYLRQHGCEVWSKDDARTLQVRNFSMNCSDPAVYVDKCRQRQGDTVANIALTLCYQMDAMLAKVLKRLEQEFLANGGLKEAMLASRRRSRGY